MSRNRLPANEAKALILSHARSLFIDKGYDRATMDDLCELTSMSKGNIYHHFKNKEDIYLQLLTLHIEQLTHSWHSPEVQSMSPTEQLIALADHYGRDCENPLLSSAIEFANTLTNDSDVLPVIMELFEVISNAVKEIVKSGVDQQSFKGTDVESMSFAVMSMLSGATQLCLTMPHLSGDEYAALHVNAIKLLLSGIATE
ncbi:TetR/AcrR family transcriptional regulator [Acetobacterium bakii]|uniref:TetR family transcriptional regulator n=1 Tax=Acetobacterium bakii TaxID=52689 RepID=A0A0L6TX56_9FIRM|nr:TetR/AcrR family transcriptional regulator [Acetobacterium bakii]KNZ40831.1 TetR family transcriptional regulator [Acetobacterium bakii]